MFKKKTNFWRLAFIYAGLVIATLFLLWSSPREPNAQMMTGSMGNMMKDMHINGTTIYSLLDRPEQQNQMGDMLSHHQNQEPIVIKLNFLLTALIFILLPLIIGGSIILAIVWIR